MGMLKKVGIFWGRQILKLGLLGGIKYEPLSDPPVIKIYEWGPWGFKSLPFNSSLNSDAYGTAKHVEIRIFIFR